MDEGTFEAPQPGSESADAAVPSSFETVERRREADQKYRRLIESLDVMVWQADPVTLQLSFVSGTIRRYGYTVEQAQQPGFWASWLHPDDRAWALRYCKRMVAERKDHALEYRVVAPDGTVRWVRDIVAVHDGPNGVEVDGVVVDITETHAERDEQQFDHLLLEASFESNTDGLAVVTPDGNLAFHNTSLLEQFALEDPRGLLQHPLLELAANQGRCDRPVAPPEEVALPNGRVALRFVTPLCSRAGNFYGQLVTFRDITDRLQNENALRESEVRFRSLIEHSSDIICVMNTDAIIEYKSPSIFDVLGFTVAEMLGTSMFAMLLEDDIPKAREAVERLLRSGTVQQIALRARHKNGSLKWFLVVFSRLETNDGPRVVANARDITERKMLETTLEQTQRMTGLGHLAATIAHEMNNVLMAIQPNVEYLGRITPDDPRLQRIVRSISQSVKRGSRITQEILRFTRPAEPRLSPVDVRHWLTDLVTEAAPMLGARVQMELHLPGGPVRILGDISALNQAVTNILINARDAMQEEGRIDISVAENHGAASQSENPLDHLVRISIRDDGPGMPPAVAERIFEPLFTTKQRGMGLGLGVVHQIITAHGGLVQVETSEGNGARFDLYLPRSEEVEAAPAQSAISIPDGLRILIVEDELAIATGLTYTLQIEGADVRALDRGEGVCDMIEEFRPAVVVLDVSLPDISGTEVLARIRARWPMLPVVFSTGHADAGRLQALLDPPLVDLVLKPYETTDLLLKLQDAMPQQ